MARALWVIIADMRSQITPEIERTYPQYVEAITDWLAGQDVDADANGGRIP